MATTVVNVKRGPCDVYCGRPSKFGNRYRIGCDGSREDVIEKFRRDFYEKLVCDSKFLQAVLELKDQVLGCHCKPLPCHVDIIADFLDNSEG